MGRSSTYYARVRAVEGEARSTATRWLKIAASPVMDHRQDRVHGAQLSHILAVISEVNESIARELDEAMGDIRLTPAQPEHV
jgi:hypothetical protein